MGLGDRTAVRSRSLKYSNTMALITEKDCGICFSPTGETVYPTCGPLIREGEEKYILSETDSEGYLEIEGICSDGAITTFNCSLGGGRVVDTGRGVMITNTCTLPIKITGFENSDPLRFSLFEYPKFVSIAGGLYTTGTAEDYLPIELDPMERTLIPTFFHPTLEELTTGSAGTFSDRTGDSFNARIDVWPGFPVLNCQGGEGECEAFFTLSGEFICSEMDKMPCLSNDENFIPPTFDTIKTIEGAYCLPNSTVLKSTRSPVGSVENIYSGLSGLAEDMVSFEPVNDNVNYLVALYTFYRAVTGIMGSGLHNNINNLFTASLPAHQTSLRTNDTPPAITVIPSSYTPNNTGVRDISCEEAPTVIKSFTGMNIYVPQSPSVVLFNAEPPEFRMIITDSGNFDTDFLCNYF